MKICIPIEISDQRESKISRHFGSAPFFTFVDTETDRYRILPNPECHDHSGSCHHVPILCAHKVEAIVCKNIGSRALRAMDEAGIDVLVTPEETVRLVVEAVRNGTARRLSKHETCGHGQRAGRCHDGPQRRAGLRQGAGRRVGHGRRQQGWGGVEDNLNE